MTVAGDEVVYVARHCAQATAADRHAIYPTLTLTQTIGWFLGVLRRSSSLCARDRRRSTRLVARKSNQLRSPRPTVVVVVVVGRGLVEDRPQQRRLASTDETVRRRLKRVRKRPLRMRIHCNRPKQPCNRLENDNIKLTHAYTTG